MGRLIDVSPVITTLLVTIHFGYVLTSCHIPLLQSCDCPSADSHEPKILNCTNQHFNKTDGLRSRFLQDFKEIIFTGNNLVNVSKNLLGTEAQHNSLERLDLSNNKIRRIDPQAFHRMQNLKTLILDENDWDFVNASGNPRLLNHSQLTELSLRHAFSQPTYALDNKATNLLKVIFDNSSMETLETLRLDSNYLVELPDNFFHLMPRLKRLHLSSNRFFKFNFKLDHLSSLEEVYLDHNAVSAPSEAFLNNLTKLEEENNLAKVYLQGNRFDCTCMLQHFRNWLADATVIANPTSLKCHSATYDKQVGQAILDIHPDDLECSAGKDVAHALQLPYIVLVVILSIVCVLGVVILYLNRQSISMKFIMCKDSLMHSDYGHYRHYSTVA